MAKDSAQLLTVRELAQTREHGLKRELGELTRRHSEAEATVERLLGYVQEYQAAELGRGARALVDIENERRFVNRLNFALQQQRVQVHRIAETITAKTRLWQRECANLKALDKLLSKRDQERLRVQERREQQQSDALGLRSNSNGVIR